MSYITQEMEEKVLEQVGFTWELYPGSLQKRWFFPDGKVAGLNPPDLFSLTVLFKWVVPKLREGSSHCDISFSYFEDGEVVCDIKISGYKGEPRAEVSAGNHELPGHALFLAICALVRAEE